MVNNIDKYFKDEKLIMIPKKLASKLEIFSFFYDLFDEDKSYSGQEINDIIKNYYPDYAIIRRYLVDYKFIGRDDFGKVYKKIKGKGRT